MLHIYAMAGRTLILSQGFFSRHLLHTQIRRDLQTMFVASNVRLDLNDYCGIYVCDCVNVNVNVMACVGRIQLMTFH